MANNKQDSMERVDAVLKSTSQQNVVDAMFKQQKEEEVQQIVKKVSPQTIIDQLLEAQRSKK